MKSIAIAIFFIAPNILFAQQKQQNVATECGREIPMTFSAQREVNVIEINLNAGSKLHFTAIPTGDYLNIRAEIFDPSGARIFPENPYKFNEPMFTEHLRQLDITTGSLSSTGIYKIKLFNYYKTYKHDERAGDYSLRVSCEN